MQNYNGFTPIQLVTGTLPNLPSVLINGIPGMEETNDGIMKNHFEKMYSARTAFVKAESSERIKRALKHPVRACEVMFNNGEKVYYKRVTDNRWHGPAKVLGHLATKVFVVHGSRVIRCSSSRVIPVNSTMQKSNDHEIDGVNVGNIVADEDNEVENNVNCEDNNTIIEEDKFVNYENDLIKKMNELCDDNKTDGEAGLRRSERTRTTPSTYVPEEGKWTNTVNEEVNTVCIPVQRHGQRCVKKTKKAELENWVATEAVDLVDNRGQRLISTRWVMTEKENSPGQFRPKARLVIRGFEETNELQVDAPTASKATMRIVLAISANKDWLLEHVDIKAAFLQGRKIERDVFVKPPPEALAGTKIWR